MAVLVVVAVAAAIGMTLLEDRAGQAVRDSVTDGQRIENSTAAVREQGAVAPASSAISHVIDLTVGLSIHVAPSLHSQGYAGFENPGAYVPEDRLPPGLENPRRLPGGDRRLAGGGRSS